MTLERFDLCEMVSELAERCSEQFLLAGCQVKIDSCDPVIGTWDRFRLEQVVTNLLTNAMRYGAGEPIEVKVRGNQDGAEIIVSDHGRGIALENHDRIFLRFDRAGLGNEICGLGLGLYIVKEILDAHHASIRVESELGRGATFVVNLPASAN